MSRTLSTARPLGLFPLLYAGRAGEGARFVGAVAAGFLADLLEMSTGSSSSESSEPSESSASLEDGVPSSSTVTDASTVLFAMFNRRALLAAKGLVATGATRFLLGVAAISMDSSE